jgi:two-component system OmpR family sensor kinase
MRLRTRLFLSYIVLLLATLASLSLALIVVLGTQPAPPAQVYARLAAIVQGLNVRGLLDQFSTADILGQRRLDQVRSVLDDFAQTRGVRVLWLAQIDSSTLVIHDSAGAYDVQADIVVNNEEFFSAGLGRTLMPGSQQIYGRFTDPDNTVWLFGGVTRRLNTLRRASIESILIVAEPTPTVTLGQALAQFSSDILPALLRATGAAVLLAVFMAAFISQSLVQPLGSLLNGVRAVTKGQYEQRVPEVGPPEIRELAQEFNIMSQEVRATQNAQRDFLANVSHDLKTPLTSIQGYAQAVLDGAARDPQQAARIIYDEAARLNRLVNELTDLIRMQAGGLTLKHSQVDVNLLINALTERLMVMAQRKNIALQTRLAPLPPISADGDRLAQVLTNLLSNALKFTESGGQVTVRTLPHPHEVEIIVEDNGIGIPAEDLPRLFERFYQVDKSRGPKRGTGLGLAIAQEIVHAHGGKISIHSDGIGKGTTVRVRLPIHPSL